MTGPFDWKLAVVRMYCQSLPPTLPPFPILGMVSYLRDTSARRSAARRSVICETYSGLVPQPRGRGERGRTSSSQSVPYLIKFDMNDRYPRVGLQLKTARMSRINRTSGGFLY